MNFDTCITRNIQFKKFENLMEQNISPVFYPSYKD